MLLQLAAQNVLKLLLQLQLLPENVEAPVVPLIHGAKRKQHEQEREPKRDHIVDVDHPTVHHSGDKADHNQQSVDPV